VSLWWIALVTPSGADRSLEIIAREGKGARFICHQTSKVFSVDDEKRLVFNREVRPFSGVATKKDAARHRRGRADLSSLNMHATGADPTIPSA